MEALFRTEKGREFQTLGRATAKARSRKVLPSVTGTTRSPFRTIRKNRIDPLGENVLYATHVRCQAMLPSEHLRSCNSNTLNDSKLLLIGKEIEALTYSIEIPFKLSMLTWYLSFQISPWQSVLIGVSFYWPIPYNPLGSMSVYKQRCLEVWRQTADNGLRWWRKGRFLFSSKCRWLQGTLGPFKEPQSQTHLRGQVWWWHRSSGQILFSASWTMCNRLAHLR